VTSNRNQVSCDRLAKMAYQMLFGRPLRPRDASVCPLDNGGLIGVRGRFASYLISTRYGISVRPA